MDATIQEGNVGRNFSPVDKLKIDLQNDGGESLWVPEDSVQLDELHAQENGTFYASTRGIYGWGKIIVDVDTSVDSPEDDPQDEWGTSPEDDEEEDPDEEEEEEEDWEDEPDEPEEDDEAGEPEEEDEDWEDEDWEDGIGGEDPETGDDIYIYTDDDGNLVEEELPAYIEIANPPLKTKYVDGDSINITGLAVLAYKADGSLWTKGNNGETGHYAHGRIPNGELSINPEHAKLVEVIDGSDGFQFTTAPIGTKIWGNLTSRDGVLRSYTIISGGRVYVCQNYNASDYDYVFLASAEPFVLDYCGADNPLVVAHHEIINVGINGSYFNTAPYQIQALKGKNGFMATNLSMPFVYREMVYYGDQAEPSEGQQQIEVSWSRYGDGKELTTSFTITVLPSGGHWGGTTVDPISGGSHYSGKF